MGKSSDEFNSNENDDENTEESSDEDEQGPNENNQSAAHADLSSLNRETTYNVRRANQDWPRLILFLAGNGTRIVESCNRNRHARNGHLLLTDIFMIMFMLFATIMFITHIPLDIENRQTHIIGMPDDVNNTYQNVPVNNENARNDNFDDDRINLFLYDETGSQVVIRESNASEAVDHRTYDSSSFISAKILNDTNFNLKIVEEKEITFSSTVELYVDDIIGIDSNSDDTHSITSVRSPISDNDDENIVSEISLDLNDNEDDQIDDSDEESSISHTEDDSNDSVSDVTDGGYDTRSESSASEISTDTNGEDTLINNDDERSLAPNISYETNSENDPIDDDDRWSDISHITYYISSEDDSINDNDTMSTDDDYGTKSEIDSLVDDEEDAASVEIQNNESADEEVSTIELSIPPTLLTDSTTETNADLLPNLKQPAIMSSMNPNNVEQSSSFDLNEEEPSSQVFDDRARNMNPDVSADIHPPTDSNAAHHQGDRQSVGSENPHHSADRQGHALPSSVLISNTLQNNEQAASQTSLPGQSSVQIEKTSNGESESDGEEMSCSTRSMNMKLQKQTSPAVDSDDESSKQNVEQTKTW